MASVDFYKELGVARDADAETIKKAFRKLALQYHPDRNQGDKGAEERFKVINRANEVLSDPKKRALYDEFGEVALRDGFDAEKARQYLRWQSGHGGSPSLEDLLGGAGTEVDLSELLSRMMGGMGGTGRRGRGESPFGGSMPFGNMRNVPMKGPDFEGEITIDFKDAVLGSERSFSVDGRTVRVRIPPGATEGARVRVPGGGGASPTGGASGDLTLTLHVEEHPSYWLEQGDLHVRVPITVPEAFRGAKVRVPTPEGEVQVTVPARTPPGAKLRVRGKGVPATKSRAATDLIVHLEVAVPDRENPGLTEALAILEAAYSQDPRAALAF